MSASDLRHSSHLILGWPERTHAQSNYCLEVGKDTRPLVFAGGENQAQGRDLFKITQGAYGRAKNSPSPKPLLQANVCPVQENENHRATHACTKKLRGSQHRGTSTYSQDHTLQPISVPQCFGLFGVVFFKGVFPSHTLLGVGLICVRSTRRTTPRAHMTGTNCIHPLSEKPSAKRIVVPTEHPHKFLTSSLQSMKCSGKTMSMFLYVEKYQPAFSGQQDCQHLPADVGWK